MTSMSVVDKAKGLDQVLTLAPIYPIIQTGPVTRRLPTMHAATASPGLRPRVTALDGTCI